MDTIKIENLKIFAYHGVFDEEKENGQDFYVNGILKNQNSLTYSSTTSYLVETSN